MTLVLASWKSIAKFAVWLFWKAAAILKTMSILSSAISAIVQKLNMEATISISDCWNGQIIVFFFFFYYYTSNSWHAPLLQNRHVFLLIKQNKDVMLVIIRETMASRNGAAPGWDAFDAR